MVSRDMGIWKLWEIHNNNRRFGMDLEGFPRENLHPTMKNGFLGSTTEKLQIHFRNILSEFRRIEQLFSSRMVSPNANLMSAWEFSLGNPRESPKRSPFPFIGYEFTERKRWSLEVLFVTQSNPIDELWGELIEYIAGGWTIKIFVLFTANFPTNAFTNLVQRSAKLTTSLYASPGISGENPTQRDLWKQFSIPCNTQYILARSTLKDLGCYLTPHTPAT